MKKQPSYKIDNEILRKYLAGNLSGEESATLKKLLDTDPATSDYLEQMEKIWDLSSGIGDFGSIDTNGDWNTWRQKLDTKTSSGPGTIDFHPRSLAYRIVRIAAVFLLVSATAFMLYYFTGQGLLSRNGWVTVYTYDSVEDIPLPDGSSITLNSGSSLAYPSRFKRNARSVKLEGEAFFEIAKDENRPFKINVANEASVEVLGTSFNLRTDPENNKVFLNVLTGKVAFYASGKKKEAKILNEDEHAVCHNGHVRQLVSVDLNFLSWKTRNLVFDNTPLAEVVDQLGRHYRKNFLITDHSLDSLALTAIYSDQKMEDVLEEIGLVLDIGFLEKEGIVHVIILE